MFGSKNGKSKEIPLETHSARSDEDEDDSDDAEEAPPQPPKWYGRMSVEVFWERYEGKRVEISTKSAGWVCWIVGYTALGLLTMDEDGIDKFFLFTAIVDVEIVAE